MADLPPLEIPGLTPGAGMARVAGAGMAEAATLSPIEILHRMSEQWLRGASPTEKAETLRVLLRNDRASVSLLRMLEGEMGEKVVTMPANKIPRAILRAAGSAKKQAQFTSTLKMLQQIKPGGASPGDLRKSFGLAMRAATQAGLPTATLDALKRMGPEGLFRAGPTNVARVYDIATRQPAAARLWRWALGKKDPLVGIRAQIDELVGTAKSDLAEEVRAAEGTFGKGKAAARGVAARVGETVSPKGLTTVEEGIVGRLTKAGAKGLGRGAKLARKLGGGGALLAVPLLGYEAYDSLVGKSKRARAALEASRRGGTASISQELMYDILDKRADLQARRATLARDPKLMQQIVQALGGAQAKTLTSSEAGYGVDLGEQGVSPGEMDEMLDRLLGQMRGT